MKNLLTLFFACLSLGAFAQDQMSEAEKIIRQNDAAFSQFLMDGDWEAVVNSYTDDAKIFPSGKDVLRNTDAIRKYWTPPADATWKMVYHRLMPEEIKIMGNEAYDWGYYEGKTQKADGTIESWKGKYVAIWREVEAGVWKMYLDIWNWVPLE